ncbi:111aa long hypothetical protein [Pyrococcus horikoshii OT3]|uniref:Uncharacterized protein n=1 Tax=Pyrococcus horikoshii (strain ATCC 700860 / DSM 12428 / JCM 9974 / NBRC 100139 / OT-3) TaxID=70601 RepID=O58500_PYRHO|nr:111aa long hypothetical protein [Pyrococcus horikoshii OT3]
MRITIPGDSLVIYSITVVIAPGPEISGMARGITATSSSVTSSSSILTEESFPDSISIPILNRSIPPAIAKASILEPKNLNIHCPTSAKTVRVMKTVIETFLATSCLISAGK